jgi:hypothetical protein
MVVLVLISALVLVLVLVVCYQCLQLYKARLPLGQLAEHFDGAPTQYQPACSGIWLGGRGRCGSGNSPTTGHMPSIEWNQQISIAPCCGSAGVPPPDLWFW